MILLPIHQNQELNAEFTRNPLCAKILEVYPSFYEKVGFNLPWIGYFASLDNMLVGCGGFKGAPKNGKVEIAYNIFQDYEGQGAGTEICKQLVLLSLGTDPSVVITARTLLPENASASILKKNEFELQGMVWDEEDGNVWEWVYQPAQTYSGIFIE